MKCKRCDEKAVIDIRRHNAAFCRDCFFAHCRKQVERAIEEHQMLCPTHRVLVGVSGGKDSLTLWDILRTLGYEADGVYIGLGIGEYSARSETLARRFAEREGARLRVIDMKSEAGFDIPGGSKSTNRPACSVCGLSKRHLLNLAGVEGGYDVVATGHNLDDEAATLFGNLLHWQTEYVGRQAAVLPARPGLVKKIKPLIRLGERETAAYAFLRGIEYVVEECPMVSGNTGLRYKEALDTVEARSPGTKQMFLAGFYDQGKTIFEGAVTTPELSPCDCCGSPTPASESGPVCAFCRVRRQLGLGQATDDRGEIAPSAQGVGRE